MPYCDVIIVGAGPAGATAAFALARAGFEVVVLEREGQGRDKPCGEGIQAPGLHMLQHMGLFDEASRSGVLFGNLVFENKGRRLALAVGGLAIRRRRLDSILADAAAQAGALMVWHSPPLGLTREKGRWCVQTEGERWSSRWLVGADGAHSWVRRRFGIASIAEGDRVGLVGHTRLLGDSAPQVRVFQTPGAEIYTVPVDAETRLVAWLGHPAALRGKGRAALNRNVNDVLHGAGILGDFAEGRAVAPLQYRAEHIAGPNWLLAGDAASQTDPITGLGVSNAMTGALAAAKTIGSALAAPGRYAAGAYLQEHRRRHRSAARLARWIHFVLARPASWPALERVLGVVPDVPATLIRTFCPDKWESQYALQHVRPLLTGDA